MAFRISLTPQARDDAYFAFEHIRAEAPKSADRWFANLFRAINSLEQMPFRCPTIPEAEELGRPLRHLWFGSYRFIFDVPENENDFPTVRVLRIWHGSRDLAAGDDLT